MTVKRFVIGGLDNRHDPSEVGSGGLVIAANIDHRDDSSVSRRKGTTATDLVGTALHSLWGSRAGTFGYVVDGSALSHLDAALTPTLIGNLPSPSPVCFVECGGPIAAVSAGGVRFVTGTAFTPFALPPTLDGEEQFKSLTSSWQGTCGAYYNGHLYVGAGDSLLFSLPGAGCYDRRDFILPIGFPVLQVFAGTSGIWVCGSTEAVFLPGSTPADLTFRPSLPFGVFSGVEVDLKDWGSSGIGFACASTRGVVLLTGDGQAVETTDAYAPPTGSGHCSLARNENGARQLLTCFTYSAEGDKYVPKALTVDYSE
jgi:hypothetical protein